MSVRIRPFSAEAFVPFGSAFTLPHDAGGRPGWLAELVNLRPGQAGPRLEVSCPPVAELPRTLPKMERHAFASQSFVPMDGADYLIAVAPPLGDADAPDPAHLRAFRVPGTVAITYAPGCWHAPLASLGAVQRFTVLSFVAGNAGDETWCDLPPGVVLAP